MSSTNKKTLKRKPSYMMDGSPHRHMKSYDEEWLVFTMYLYLLDYALSNYVPIISCRVHEPLARISHLSADSIAFALVSLSKNKENYTFITNAA